MRGRCGEITPERIAQIIFLGSHDIRHFICNLLSFPVYLRLVISKLLAVHQILMHLGIIFKVGPKGFHQPVCILRTLLQQRVDGNEGIRHYRQSVDQAAASVVFGSLSLRVSGIDSGFYSAHHRGQEGYLQKSDRL